ncbi:MAG: hypothetical protein ACYTBJ_10475 [Planctomycetota bacterium]|jgi:hypothetical protein
MDPPILKPEEIIATIEKLGVRIHERFPQSGLSEVCTTLHEISKETDSVVQWISRPNYLMRLAIAFVLLVLLLVLSYSLAHLNLDIERPNFFDFVQITEAAVNELVLIGAGIVFLVTFENRRKRKRVIRAANKLRCLAHIIDAHQLIKDPDRTSKIFVPTEHSPEHTLSDYELGRYLDYCSEMLSLTGKLAFLYVQNFDDPLANTAVNDLENLTNAISRKIWQKIMILRSRQ